MHCRQCLTLGFRAQVIPSCHCDYGERLDEFFITGYQFLGRINVVNVQSGGGYPSAQYKCFLCKLIIPFGPMTSLASSPILLASHLK